MRRIALFLGATTIALAAVACNEPADTHDANVKAIKNIETQWNQDYVQKDATSLPRTLRRMRPDGAGNGGDYGQGRDPNVFDANDLRSCHGAELPGVQGGGGQIGRPGLYEGSIPSTSPTRPRRRSSTYMAAIDGLSQTAGGTWRAVSDIATPMRLLPLFRRQKQRSTQQPRTPWALRS